MVIPLERYSILFPNDCRLPHRGAAAGMYAITPKKYRCKAIFGPIFLAAAVIRQNGPAAIDRYFAASAFFFASAASFKAMDDSHWAM